MHDRRENLRRAASTMILAGLLFLPLLAILRPVILAESAAGKGRQAADRGDSADAAHQFALAASYAPGRDDLWEAAGTNAWAAADPHTAIFFLERAESIGGLSTRGWVALGDSFQQVGETGSAAAAWEQAISHGGDPLGLFERLTTMYQAEGDYAGLYYALKGLALERPSSETFLQLGLLGAVFEPDAAFAYLTRAVEMDASLAVTSEGIQRSIRRARLIDDDPAFLLTSVGRSLASLGEWALAGQSFERAIEVNPAYAEAWAFLGEARQQTGQDPMPALERAYTLAPDSVSVNTFLALHWLRRGQPDLAVRYLETAAAQDPQNPALMAELGSAVAAAGDLQTGLQLFLEAVATEPQNNVFWRLLAGFSISHNLDIQSVGLPAARQAQFLDPEDPAALDLIGSAYMALGNSVLAERFFMNAQDVDRTYAPAALHLGMLYIGTGETDKARPQLVRVLEFAPGTIFSDQAKRLMATYIP